MLSDKPFTKETLDRYLKELAIEFKRKNRKGVSAEVILIGGASVVINYGFREMTYDMDAIITATASMKEAINAIGDKYDLPTGWLNTDFMKTRSYSPKIALYSKYYKTYSNIVSFRTVTGEYLLVMKLMAGRQYKYDMSDVIGILWEQEKSGMPISLETVKKAATDLYGTYEALPDNSREFIEKALADRNYEELYDMIRNEEKENKNILLTFEEEYPGITNSDNVRDIIAAARKKL